MSPEWYDKYQEIDLTTKDKEVNKDDTFCGKEFCSGIKRISYEMCQMTTAQLYSATDMMTKTTFNGTNSTLLR